MFRIVYKKAAVKAMAKMPRGDRRRMESALAMLAENPDRDDLDVKPLQGRPGFRLRIGSWRALYQMESDQLILVVVKVGARGDVYK